MTHEEFCAFASVYDKVEERCKHVFELLADIEFNVWWEVFFKVLQVNVECIGLGNAGIYNITFPSYLLFSTDEEIIKYRQENLKMEERPSRLTFFTNV